MSGKLPAVQGKDVVRVLQKFGWIVVHVRGSHHKLEHLATKRSMTVAVHAGQDMRPWLVRKILEEARVGIEDFRKSL